MKRVLGISILCMLAGVLLAQQKYNVRAPYDPATVKVEEKMRGEVLKFTLSDSQIYPGTEREILVYVPQHICCE